ncbi:GntR family transcriptional regulator [Candidatus Rariloculus sp.]|uniref:GntR family transcriptional regulator n=1 Tax=Candidatus Rariloculus sp. TaxID=3101265 RepID=UPI003D0DC30A
MEFSEPRGIYLQIADQIRDRILQGEWQSGERIPSIRELAIELGVNPNTVTKSYQTLLDWGIVANQRGRGYFVSDRAAERALTAMREEFVRDELPKVVRAMETLGIGIDELTEYLAQQDGEREK